MNRADEAALAWALIDSAPRLMPKAARTRLWMEVGAGDTDSAIVEMLTVYAESDEELPPELARTLDCWVRGYQGADAEQMLRGLLDRIDPYRRVRRTYTSTRSARSTAVRRCGSATWE